MPERGTRLRISKMAITGDITGVETYGTIFSVAESYAAAGVIWAGSDDGLVHVSCDAGARWTDVTPRGLPVDATIECIETSRRDEADEDVQEAAEFFESEELAPDDEDEAPAGEEEADKA